MSVPVSTRWGENGVGFVMSEPFAGYTGDIIARVGAENYCSTLRAYYAAVARVGLNSCDSDVECCRDASKFGGEYIGRIVGCSSSFGSVVGEGEAGVLASADDGAFVPSGLAGCGCSAKNESKERSGGIVGESVDANDDDVSGNYGGERDSSRGPNWRRNRAKRMKAKEKKRVARSCAKVDGSGGCVSDSSASVVTVDTRTGVEIEAAQTLAARRVVENKLAIARGEVQLRSYANKDKTKALERLDAARMEQRINEAKAKSQASYKKCDESMKSLGSSGSAGEFALKQEVKRAKDNAAILAYVQAQADFMVKHVSPEVLAQVAAMPPPVLENEFDVFGDCPESFTEDQRESYFLGLARQQEENDMRTGIPC